MWETFFQKKLKLAPELKFYSQASIKGSLGLNHCWTQGYSAKA